MASPLLIVIAVLFAIILFILWTLLPFAVFGTKARLDKIIQLLEDQQRSQHIDTGARRVQGETRN